MTNGVTPPADSPMGATAELHQKNGERLRVLEQKNAQIPDIAIINARLNLLIDFLVGPAVRGSFDHVFEQLIEGMLDEWEPQVARAQLTAGIDKMPPPPA